MENQTTQFLPFNAINEFMRMDYRQEVVRVTLTSLPDLPENFRITVDQITRATVQVPGFRNSAKAPLIKRVKPTADAFEKSPHMVAVILSAWSEVHSELRQQVFDLLLERGWELLPPAADRTQLPGFIMTWPNGESFEILTQAFSEKYPDTKASNDDVSLMIVWLSVRLPYQFDEDLTKLEDQPPSDHD